MIVWTNRFPEKEKAAGYLRLVRARMNFFDQIKPGRNGAGKFGFYRRPGFQTTLRHMRNKHQGKPGFIIGNGPSLKEMDLTPLRDQITFGANGIYQMFDEWGFHTKYLLFEDTEQTELRRKEIHNVVGPTKMAAIYNAYCFKNFDDTLFFNARRGDPYYFDEMGIQFSRDFSNIVYLGSPITYIALQLAYYLGCNPVYLIGVDHSYGALAKNFPPGKIEVTKENYELVRQCHMNPDYYQIGDVIGVPNTSLQDKAYEVAADAYKQAGREIYNAGVNSFLDAFPRTDFDSIFKK